MRVNHARVLLLAEVNAARQADETDGPAEVIAAAAFSDELGQEPCDVSDKVLGGRWRGEIARQIHTCKRRVRQQSVGAL